MPFEEVQHTADVALHVWGATLEELFALAAEGMFQLIGAEADAKSYSERTIDLAGPDPETMLVAWLDELLFLIEHDDWRPATFEFAQLGAGRLRASVRGGPLRAVQKHIKAVTFNELAIRTTESGYEVTVVFDV